MNNVSIRIAGCFLVLAAIIWTMGCGPSAPNNNVPQNENANAARTTTALVPSTACTAVTLTDRRQQVEDEIKRLIGANPKLAAQYGSGAFDFQVVIVNSYLEAHFKGLIGGGAELQDLSNILRTFKQDGCLLMVRMASKNAGTGSIPSVRLVGFEWNLCDWPEIPCPDGTCKQACSISMDTNANGNTNTSANTNANGNTNTSSNTNANRSTNTNSPNMNR